MQNKPIRFGIIGTGAIASVHASCINEIDEAELIAMASSSAERAKQAKKQFNIPVYDDYNALLQHTDIDVVIICTQSGAHLEPTIAAAQLGKHVLTEKPLEVSLDRADEMIKGCDEANVMLGCVFQNRFSPDYTAAKKAVKEGFLGQLLMGNASINWYRTPEYYSGSPWRGTLKGDGGAALINQGIHTIDLLLDIMGDAESVFARTKTKVHNIEGEDTATALVSFKNGALGTITAGTSLYPGYAERLEIYGEKGSIILEAGKIKEWNVEGQNTDNKEQAETKTSGSSDPMAIGNTLHKIQIEDMIRSVKTNQKPQIDGAQGRKSLALIMGIYESNKTRLEVML